MPPGGDPRDKASANRSPSFPPPPPSFSLPTSTGLPCCPSLTPHTPAPPSPSCPHNSPNLPPLASPPQSPTPLRLPLPPRMRAQDRRRSRGLATGRWNEVGKQDTDDTGGKRLLFCGRLYSANVGSRLSVKVQKHSVPGVRPAGRVTWGHRHTPGPTFKRKSSQGLSSALTQA